MFEEMKKMKEEMLKSSKGAATRNIMETAKEDDWLTTSSHDLNRVLSGSLYRSIKPKDHVGIVGPEAAGKSSMMCILAADAQSKGYLPVVINAEGAWDTSFITRWGLDPENIIEVPTMWVDDIQVNLTEWIDKGYKKLCIIIDSIGALELRKVITDGLKGDVKADQGRLQKEIKRMLKLIVYLCKFHDCIALSAGHYYGNPTGYGDPDQIGGGKYYRLSCDSIITLKKTPLYENPSGANKTLKGKIIGNSITAATVKNRNYPPFQEAQLNINFKNGVDKFAGIIPLAIDMGLITKGGAWYTCECLDIKSQGEANLLKDIKESDYKVLFDQIEEVLKDTQYSTINVALKEAVELIDEEKGE